MKVPYLSDTKIEEEAARVLRAHAKRTGRPLEPPISIEDIVEIDLGLSVDFDDLQGQFGGVDVLGAYCPRKRAIFIDSSLDPVNHPHLEPRSRFTLGHEGGHDVIHGWLFRGGMDLFGQENAGRPSVICRKGTAKPRIEQQADKFSAFILMPRQLVIQQWREVIREQKTEAAISVLVRRFCVSRQAMQIRLRDLGLIPETLAAGFWPQSAA